jgi:hypothetical protein
MYCTRTHSAALTPERDVFFELFVREKATAVESTKRSSHYYDVELHSAVYSNPREMCSLSLSVDALPKDSGLFMSIYSPFVLPPYSGLKMGCLLTRGKLG